MKPLPSFLAALGILLTGCVPKTELGAFLQIPNHENIQHIQSDPLNPDRDHQAIGYGKNNERFTPLHVENEP